MYRYSLHYLIFFVGLKYLKIKRGAYLAMPGLWLTLDGYENPFSDVAV